MTAREAIARLTRENWTQHPGAGSHQVFRKDGRRVVVSSHWGNIPTGILKEICRTAGWEYLPAC